ncbi:MAG TPA: hypothetical protein VFK57_22390 [Vicinamibacterales bacterium]|nr:hypothetical protein [Vicinamibacterales bacterium]
MPPESLHGSGATFAAVLERARARMRLQHVLRAGAIASGAAAAAALTLLLTGAPGVWRAGLTLVAFTASAWASMHSTRRARTRGRAAAAIERADRSLRNLAVTAAQLLDSSDGVRPYMRERVLREASARTAGVDLRRGVPIARDAAALAAAVLAAVAVMFVRLPAISGAPPSASRPTNAVADAGAADLIVELTPAPYTGRPASRLVNPAALDVLGGTEALVRAPGGAAARIRLNGTTVPVRADGSARVTFTESGYLAVDSGAGHRLVPLTVTPDAAPAVRITAPAKDLRVPSGAATIPIAAGADDDLGLASFDLRYTVVSGSGEQFTFTEGTLPAVVQRGSGRSWQLRATLSLGTLKLEPGDALIYRAVAADRRPGGAGVAASDTFFVEIAGPGDVPLEGVEMPPDKERYAMSQAMIVLKLERLQAREPSLKPEALAEDAGNIAAEQRAVRANFVFLLGGEVEDEEQEAEHSHEISEGRFANQARKEIVAATVLMSHVERALAAASTRAALPPARAALEALQRAFGNSRYLLRALPSRVRLDPARRLSGDVSTAADWDRALAPPAPDPVTESARAALAELVAVSTALDLREQPKTLGDRLRGLGERVLTAAARAPELQPAAQEIAAAQTALASGRIDAARDALRRAGAPLAKRAQHGRIDAAGVPREPARLAGAAALGRGGAR